MGVLETALHALQMLDQCDAPSALVGGLAVSVRTEPRNTRDFDFAIGTLDDNHAESVVRALTAADYRIVAVLEQEATGRLATVRLRRTGDPALVDLLFASSGVEPNSRLSMPATAVTNSVDWPRTAARGDTSEQIIGGNHVGVEGEEEGGQRDPRSQVAHSRRPSPPGRVGQARAHAGRDRRGAIGASVVDLARGRQRLEETAERSSRPSREPGRLSRRRLGAHLVHRRECFERSARSGSPTTMPRKSLACSSILLVAAGCLDPGEDVARSSAAVAVTWTNAVGVTPSGNDLAKTAGTTGWNAGAVSVESILGDGYVELTSGEANTNKMAGLSVGDSGQGRADIDFAIQLRASGTVGVYEAGVLRGGNFTSYAPGDRLRVEAKAGVVKYSKNGAVFYTSAVAPGSPLLVDTSLNTPGATLLDVELVATSLHWQNLIAVSASGDDLSKTGTDAAWTAGASSIETLAGDGFVEFTATEANTLRMAGLGNGDPSAHFSDIEYGIRLKANGVIGIYEAGVERVLNAGTYLPGDTFRVEVSGGVVAYHMNGGPPLYTSQVAPSFPLRVDTSLHTPGATLTDFRLVEDAAACPAYQGDGPICNGTFVVNNAFDLAEIAACAEITGNLTIQAPGMPVIALPALERVGGTFTVIGNPELQRLRLPQLKEVSGTFTMTLAAATTGVDLSRLTTGSALSLTAPSLRFGLDCLDSAASLSVTSATAPRLRTVSGDVTALAIEAPALTDIGGLIEIGDGVHVPALQRAHDIHIRGDTAPLDLPALVEVDGDFLPLVPSGPALLDLPALERAGRLFTWQGLVEFHMPLLEEVDTLGVKPATMSELPALSSVTGSVEASNARFPVLSKVGGSLTIHSAPVEVPVLARVDGGLSVTLQEAYLTSFEAPALEMVGANVIVSTDFSTASMNFPLLTYIGGNFATNLLTMSTPVLSQVSGDLLVNTPFSGPALTQVGGTLLVQASFDAPALTEVGGAVTLSGSGVLDAPVLTTIRGSITTSVLELSLPALTSCRSILHLHPSSLATLELPSLTTMSGKIDIRDSQLTSLSFPSLETMTGTMTIHHNVSLTSLAFPALTSLGQSLKILNNRELPTCQATQLRDQLVAAGWTGNDDIAGNDDGGTCPQHFAG